MKTWILVTSIPKQAKKLLADGTDVETCNAMVAGETKKAIIAAFKAHGVECSPYLLSEYGSEVSVGTDGAALAETYAGQVYVQKLNDNSAPWFVLDSLEVLARREQAEEMDEAWRRAARSEQKAREETYDLLDEIVGYPV